MQHALVVEPIDVDTVLKDRVYDRLKQAITAINIYATREPIRLDERQLAEDLGVSRTPIREAIGRLEQDGFVRVLPRRGAFIVRRTKKEILELITVWAALESMAARLITLSATDAEIKTLRAMFATFDGDGVRARIDEYSDTNIRFHARIIELSHSDLLAQMTENLFIHMRSIRVQTIVEDDRVRRSIIDHMKIIEALEARDTELAERLVRQHALDLAAHVERHATYLD